MKNSSIKWVMLIILIAASIIFINALSAHAQDTHPPIVSAGSSDNSSVDNSVLCLPPSNLKVDIHSTHEVTLSWLGTTKTTENKYLVEIRITGTPNFYQYPVTTNTRDLNNLIPGAMYEWRVRAHCDNAGKQQWGDASDIQTFALPIQKQIEQETAQSHFALNVYPNPAANVLKVDFYGQNEDAQSFTVEVFDTMGREVFFNRVMALNGLIKTSVPIDKNFINGIYVLRINTGAHVFEQNFMVAN